MIAVRKIYDIYNIAKYGLIKEDEVILLRK